MNEPTNSKTDSVIRSDLVLLGAVDGKPPFIAVAPWPARQADYIQGVYYFSLMCGAVTPEGIRVSTIDATVYVADGRHSSGVRRVGTLSASISPALAETPTLDVQVNVTLPSVKGRPRFTASGQVEI